MAHDIEDSPQLALVVVAPNGKLYKLEASTWSDQANLVEDPQAQGMVNELTQLGTYLASIPNDFAAGAGIECIVVNVKSIVE
jgi:hypothetical protein